MFHAADYLDQASQADEAAKRAVTPIAKQCWRTIAETYRLMAQANEHNQSPKPPDTSPANA